MPVKGNRQTERLPAIKDKATEWQQDTKHKVRPEHKERKKRQRVRGNCDQKMKELWYLRVDNQERKKAKKRGQRTISERKINTMHTHNARLRQNINIRKCREKKECSNELLIEEHEEAVNFSAIGQSKARN